MSYDVVAVVLIMAAYCFLMQIITAKVVFGAMKKEEPKFELRPHKEPVIDEETEKQRKYQTIMDNLEAFDGTEVGQKEVK